MLTNIKHYVLNTIATIHRTDNDRWEGINSLSTCVSRVSNVSFYSRVSLTIAAVTQQNLIGLQTSSLNGTSHNVL